MTKMFLRSFLGSARVLTVFTIALLHAPLSAAPGSAEEPARTGSVSVSVVDATGAVVHDARVTLVELGRAVFVDENGTARFEDVPAGDFHVEAVSRMWGATVAEIEVAAGEERPVRLELGRSMHSERIVVTATPGGRGSAELAVPIDVLDEEELALRMQPTLGETLAREPGVHSTFFAAGASRPIIRGQGGGRVSVLESGLAVGDASTTSPDHALSTDPLSAETVEIVRGPAALLYDTSAIGGLVNILDGRIPDHAPDDSLSGSLDLRLGSAADERTAGGNLDGGGERFAWHVDGVVRDTHDYEIAGPSIEGDPTSPADRLPNSSVESSTATLGGSVLFERGYVGVSGRSFDTTYGIQEIELEPVGIPPAEEEEGAGVSIDLEQRRFDLRGGFRFPEGFVDSLTFGAGATDYEHTEFENGAPGTVFSNENREARVEVAHHQGTSMPGVIGLQYRNRDARAEGEEAFVPRSETDTLAIFAFQEIAPGPVRLQLGGRWETVDLGVRDILPEIADRIATNSNCTSPQDVDFDSLSASAGVVWLHDSGYGVGGAVSRAVRAPNSEELYSCGPHLATQSFEVGDTNLDEEVGVALDLSLRKRTGRLTGQISLFHDRFQDYVLEELTGRVVTEEGEEFDPILTPDPEHVLPEYRYRQADADFRGAEAGILIDLFENDAHHLDLELTGDTVRADLRRDDVPLPRIPATRYGLGFHYRGNRWYGSASVQHTEDQDRLAPSETLSSPLLQGLEQIGGPTDSYTMLDALAGYRFVQGGWMHDLSLRGTNLTDEEGRLHTSRLKNVAPLPGIDIGILYRLVF
jgi:iron complex outermembrane receptor protein